MRRARARFSYAPAVPLTRGWIGLLRGLMNPGHKSVTSRVRSGGLSARRAQLSAGFERVSALVASDVEMSGDSRGGKARKWRGFFVRRYVSSFRPPIAGTGPYLS